MANRIKNFKKLIKYFEKNAIDYAVLGRKESLDEIIDGDIDIVVSKNNFNQIEHILNTFCNSNNMLFIQNIQHESTAKYMIISDNSDHSIICPDICSHYVRDARLLIDNDTLLENTMVIEVEGFRFKALKPQYEFVYYFLKKIDKSNMGEREFAHLLEQYSLIDSDEKNTLLMDYFSKESIKKIDTIFRSKDVNSLKDSVSSFKRELHSKKQVKWSFLIKDKILKLRRIFKKTGLSISIMGPDGCGKSTVIDALMENLKPAFRKVHYYHLKPSNKKNDKTNVTDPQNQIPYSFFKSLIKLGYLLLQYNIGYIGVFKKLIKSTFVIFDRYYNDILVDRLRFRYGAPILFAKAALFFIPKPKLYFFLNASGEVIYGRKKELSIQEINRQRDCYLKIFQNKKNHFIIDAEQQADSVIFNIEEIILNYLNKRQSKRF